MNGQPLRQIKLREYFAFAASVVSIVAGIAAIVALAAWWSERDIREQTREIMALQLQQLSREWLDTFRGTTRDASPALRDYLRSMQVAGAEGVSLAEIDLSGLTLHDARQFDLNGSSGARIVRTGFSGNLEIKSAIFYNSIFDSLTLNIENVDLDSMTIMDSTINSKSINSEYSVHWGIFLAETIDLSYCDARGSDFIAQNRMSIEFCDLRGAKIDIDDPDNLSVIHSCYDKNTRWPVGFTPPDVRCESEIYKCGADDFKCYSVFIGQNRTSAEDILGAEPWER